MDADPVIVARNLVKRYKDSDTEALKGINFTVNRGEFLGLLGPNAAGKTTFTSILCGLLRPTSGEIMVFGNDMTASSSHVKRRMGLVPQEIALYGTLTVRENILFFGHLLGYHGKELGDRTDNLIDRFSLAHHSSRLLSKCSGGIKRRVNLICGIIHEPELLILDEPTLGVDTQLREMIFGYLEILNKNGTTIIYTTHYMREAELLCSKISIIDNGLIITEGRTDELIESNEGCSDLGQVFIRMTGRDLRD